MVEFKVQLMVEIHDLDQGLEQGLDLGLVHG